jgi:NADH-quinone oxidoreductase subunit A
VPKGVRVRVSPSAPYKKHRQHRTQGTWFAVSGSDRKNRRVCASGFSEFESTMNLDQYLPVLLFILVGVGVGVVPQVLGRLLGPVRPDSEKNSPYECGFEAFEDARMKFDVRYYLVAILFILFDLEIAFLFPWAVALKEIGAVGFWSVMIFLGILVVGFIYEWKKGALDWE